MYQKQTVKIIGVGGGRAGKAPKPVIRAGRAPVRRSSVDTIIAKAKDSTNGRN